ncbi:MAG: hypothetical protein EBZ48_15450 [Proteobacteria bacterium]|nr:hypothetical protein [Pseudomonadota bacterium]
MKVFNRAHFGRGLLTLILVVGITDQTALAVDPTPTASPTPTVAPTSTPTPTACELSQICIDAAVPTAVASCNSSNSCTPPANSPYEPEDRFAISAGTLAARAIASTQGGCATKTLKAACNRCYTEAGKRLKNKYDGPLFHGLLARAAGIVATKKARCDGLPAKKPR